MKPGAHFGRILSKVYDMQLSGKVKSLDDALNAAKSMAESSFLPRTLLILEDLLSPRAILQEAKDKDLKLDFETIERLGREGTVSAWTLKKFKDKLLNYEIGLTRGRPIKRPMPPPEIKDHISQARDEKAARKKASIKKKLLKKTIARQTAAKAVHVKAPEFTQQDAADDLVDHVAGYYSAHKNEKQAREEYGAVKRTGAPDVVTNLERRHREEALPR